MNKEKKNLVVFGYGLAVICAFVAWRHTVKHGADGWTMILAVLAAAFTILTALNPYNLAGFYRRWMAVAHVIGLVVSTVILSLVFYLMFGIAGLILRLMKKDFLDRTIELDRKSYWVNRPAQPFNPDDYKRQF